MDKRTLRSRQRAWRASVPAETRRAEVDRAVGHLLARPEWSAASTVALYAALPGEPDLHRLAHAAWGAGKRVALPITPRRGHPLAWRLHLPDVPLVRGRFEVPVPPPDAEPVLADAIELVVVPALAVDPRGYRLGYGGGFYDRTLPGLTRASAVWLGLEAQVLPEVPVEPTDRPVHALVTGSGWRSAR